MRTEKDTDLIAMLLRDQPPCTAAEISHFAIAFWDGERLAWATLKEDGSGQIDSRLTVDLDVWDELCSYVMDWVDEPRYSVRPELRAWMNNVRSKSTGQEDKHE